MHGYSTRYCQEFFTNPEAGNRSLLLYNVFMRPLTLIHLKEWFGVGMLVLFLLHNILYIRWYGNLFKGKYTLHGPMATAKTMHLAVSYWRVVLMSIHLGFMLLKQAFVFFDFEQSAVFVFAEYIAMMGLWVFIGFYAIKITSPNDITK